MSEATIEIVLDGRADVLTIFRLLRSIKEFDKIIDDIYYKMD